MVYESKHILTPSQSIQKSYLRQPTDMGELENFRCQLEILLNELNPTDPEESNKGRVKTFLKQTLWPSTTYEINASEKTDLTIKDKNIGRNVVLFEFKKVNSAEMVTKDNLVKKAMFELVLYYILEEHEKKNTSIKHLVISDGYKYFIFEKAEFWELFGKDRKLVSEIKSSENTANEKREYIYNQIIRPKVEAVKDKLSFTFVDLETIAKETSAADIIAKPRFKALFKLFSPIHLQKLPFAEDHNTLNRKFYTELLYIMGLEERGEKHQIQRLEAKKRQAYSVFEQAYALLADYDITTDKVTGREIDARFETALGLVIVWINRTLFMKLLESQLIAFNGSKRKYAFFDKLTDFALMHYLFCKVMAIPEAERSDEMRAKFGEVPYLNSSLFELTDIEQKYFPISSLRDSEVAGMKNTCLKDNKGKTLTGRIHILDYLKRFLDSYDFGADTGESGKTIINASVLGLIFEKINGYKDGSFFTPGYITSYLCRETLRRCVTDKYNQTYATQYASFDELAEDFDPTDKTRRGEQPYQQHTHLRPCGRQRPLHRVGSQRTDSHKMGAEGAEDHRRQAFQISRRRRGRRTGCDRCRRRAALQPERQREPIGSGDTFRGETHNHRELPFRCGHKPQQCRDMPATLVDRTAEKRLLHKGQRRQAPSTDAAKHRHKHKVRQLVGDEIPIGCPY